MCLNLMTDDFELSLSKYTTSTPLKEGQEFPQEFQEMHCVLAIFYRHKDVGGCILSEACEPFIKAPWRCRCLVDQAANFSARKRFMPPYKPQDAQQSLFPYPFRTYCILSNCITAQETMICFEEWTATRFLRVAVQFDKIRVCSYSIKQLKQIILHWNLFWQRFWLWNSKKSQALKHFCPIIFTSEYQKSLHYIWHLGNSITSKY